MYNAVYDEMVHAGIAEKVMEDVMYDVSGNITNDKTKMYGRPTKYILTRPEELLFVDETGCNTNMKQDGHVGGEMFLLPCEDAESGISGAVTDMHFSVLCFTSGTGEPVLCAVILKSNKDIVDIPINWRLGIDLTKNVEEERMEADLFESNQGESKLMPGGPKCTYMGKDIPCFVGSSPNACITPEMLAGMLKTIDDRKIFEGTRESGRKPFLLLDGHQSRFKLPFLDYIHDKSHPWTVCIGVPYGTHIWQVADAPQLNGSIKMELYKAKRQYLLLKDDDNKKISPTDIIPLINMS
jgi:hypothetical protein